jgi:hypothetical protein
VDQRPLNLPLFPNRARWVGISLFLAGLVSGYLYFLGSRPAFFQVPVFAIVSSYMENRFLVIAQTNILDELFAIFCLAGIFLIVFSREANEHDGDDLIRASALQRAVYLTAILWGFTFLLVFGYSIFLISTFVFAVLPVIYYIFFRILRHRDRSRVE